MINYFVSIFLPDSYCNCVQNGGSFMMGNLYQIVSKFPGVIEYREKLLCCGGNLKKYLLLVGGTITIRDACIDYISSLPFLGVDKLMCSGLSMSILKEQFLSLDNKATEHHLNNQNKDVFNSKLLVLNDIFCFDKNILIEFFRSVLNSNDLIATISTKAELDKLPLVLRKKFKVVDISTNNKKVKLTRDNYPPKYEIDNLLKGFIEKFPNRSRRIIVSKAFPVIKKKFAGKSMYKKSTLITRVSMLRNRLRENSKSDYNLTFYDID